MKNIRRSHTGLLFIVYEKQYIIIIIMVIEIQLLNDVKIYNRTLGYNFTVDSTNFRVNLTHT